VRQQRCVDCDGKLTRCGVEDYQLELVQDREKLQTNLREYVYPGTGAVSETKAQSLYLGDGEIEWWSMPDAESLYPRFIT
jgi:hypothetical protein